MSLTGNPLLFSPMTSAQTSIAIQGWGLYATVRQFDAGKLLASARMPLSASADSKVIIELAGGKWECELLFKPVASRPDAVDGEMKFRLIEGAAEQCSVAIEIDLPDWRAENYLLFPAAVYNGNRFTVRKQSYPPIYKDPADICLTPPILITDVPHLETGEGESRIQLNTGDMATPCIAFHSPSRKQAFLLLTRQETRLGNSGLQIRENASRTNATITLEAPGMRSDGIFSNLCSTVPTIDRAPAWRPGQSVTIPFRLFLFTADNLQWLFDRFAQVRKDLSKPVPQRHEIPFSAAWSIQENKFNRDNWRDSAAGGHYTIGTDGSVYSDWQLGWVGGGMSGLPLLFAGDKLSRQRAISTINFLFARTQRPCGLLVGMVSVDRNVGDGFETPGTDRWVMTRKLGDGLYFVMKHILLLARSDNAWQLPELWKSGTLRLADALVAIWDKQHQFGQLLDYETGEIVQGGSTAGAIIPAALALVGQYFKNQRYIDVAEASAQMYYQRDVKQGLTTGGPGEILNCPDSESSFAMLESLVVLYEVTGKKVWLDRAGEMARQFCTWVHSYDYRFPPDSPFGQLGMQTTGSVWANVQNKHSAPGICTLSGDVLLKLWRATQDPWYLELLRDIVHGTPQYLSRADRPVQGMPDGWMCERVNTCDWEFNSCPPGHVFYGSCWCETSNMLSYVEVPGLYVNVDLSLVVAFDHIDVELMGRDGDGLKLRLRNPTKFDAKVRVLSERKTDLANPLGQLSLWGKPEVIVPAGKTVEYTARA